MELFAECSDFLESPLVAYQPYGNNKTKSKYVYISECQTISLQSLSQLSLLHQSPKNKSQSITRDILSCIIHVFFCVALSLQVHTPMYKNRQTDIHCHLPMHVSHRGTTWAHKASLYNQAFLNPVVPPTENPISLLSFALWWVHTVYRHNIWQSERSSGGYCVILAKWLTPWEGWGWSFSQTNSLLLCKQKTRTEWNTSELGRVREPQDYDTILSTVLIIFQVSDMMALELSSQV